MIRIQDRPIEGIDGMGGCTPRGLDGTPLPDRLAFPSKGSGPQNLPKSLRAVGYLRVSTDDQAESGLGLAAQRLQIETEADRRNWSLVTIRQDAASGKSTANRPALAKCLADLQAGRADLLIVAKLDRLTRSTLDFATLLERFHRKNWGLIVLDLGVDTSTPVGEVMASVVAAFAQYERRIIGQRTKAALAAAKARGVKLGRARQHGPAVEQAARNLRAAGMSIRAVGLELRLPKSSIQNILDRRSIGA
jgi:DNA invertase Pin-like site-specific DNA recombinase